MSSNCLVTYPKHSLLREQKILQYAKITEEAQSYVWRDAHEKAYWNKQAKSMLREHMRGNKSILAEAAIRYYAGSKNTSLVESKLLSEGYFSRIADALGKGIVGVMKKMPGYKTSRMRNWWIFGGGGEDEDARYQEAYDQAQRLEMSAAARVSLQKYFKAFEEYIRTECGGAFPNHEGEGSGKSFKIAIDLVAKAAMGVRVAAGDPKVYEDMADAGIPFAERPTRNVEFAITKEEGDELIAGLRKRLQYWDRNLEQRYALAMEVKTSKLPTLAELYLNEAPKDERDIRQRANDLGKKGTKTSTMEYLKSNVLPLALGAIGAAGVSYGWLVKQDWFIKMFYDKIVETAPETLAQGPPQFVTETLDAGASQHFRSLLPLTDPNTNVSSYQLKDLIRTYTAQGLTLSNGEPTSNLIGLAANPEAFAADWKKHVMANFSKNPEMTLGKAMPLSSKWGMPGGTLTLKIASVVKEVWPSQVIPAMSFETLKQSSLAASMVAGAGWASGVGIGLMAIGAGIKLMRRYGAKNSRASYIDAALKLIDDINLPELPPPDEIEPLPPSPTENAIQNNPDVIEKAREALGKIDDPRVGQALKILEDVAKGEVVREPSSTTARLVNIVLRDATKEGSKPVNIQMSVQDFLDIMPKEIIAVAGFNKREDSEEETAEELPQSKESMKDVSESEMQSKFTPGSLAAARLFYGLALKKVGYDHEKEQQALDDLEEWEDSAEKPATPQQKTKQLERFRKELNLAPGINSKVKAAFNEIARECQSIDQFRDLMEARGVKYTLRHALYQINTLGIDPGNLLSEAEADSKTNLLTTNDFAWTRDRSTLDMLFSYANTLRKQALVNKGDFDYNSIIDVARKELSDIKDLPREVDIDRIKKLFVDFKRVTNSSDLDSSANLIVSSIEAANIKDQNTLRKIFGRYKIRDLEDNATNKKLLDNIKADAAIISKAEEKNQTIDWATGKPVNPSIDSDATEETPPTPPSGRGGDSTPPEETTGMSDVQKLMALFIHNFNGDGESHSKLVSIYKNKLGTSFTTNIGSEAILRFFQMMSSSGTASGRTIDRASSFFAGKDPKKIEDINAAIKSFAQFLGIDADTVDTDTFMDGVYQTVYSNVAVISVDVLLEKIKEKASKVAPALSTENIEAHLNIVNDIKELGSTPDSGGEIITRANQVYSRYFEGEDADLKLQNDIRNKEVRNEGALKRRWLVLAGIDKIK
jgi:hypothetical protein